MINIILIGLGGMGFVHYTVYKNMTECQVVAVVDVRTDMALTKLDGDEVKLYSSFEEAIKNENADYVDICTPSYMHAEMSIKVLSAGFHVLCEKPMALSSEDCDRVIRCAKENNRIFMTAHVVRFMKSYIYLKNEIDSSELGKLLRLDMKRLSSIPRWSWENWMLDFSKSGLTPFDLSIHDIDFIQYIFGMPDAILCIYHQLVNYNDFISTQFTYGDATVSAEASWYNCDYPFEAHFNAVFENGYIKLNDGKLYKNGEEVSLDTDNIIFNTGINISDCDGYAAEISYFVNCIKSGKQPLLVAPESSRDSIKLIETILSEAVRI